MIDFDGQTIIREQLQEWPACDNSVKWLFPDPEAFDPQGLGLTAIERGLGPFKKSKVFLNTFHSSLQNPALIQIYPKTHQFLPAS